MSCLTSLVEHTDSEQETSRASRDGLLDGVEELAGTCDREVKRRETGGGCCAGLVASLCGRDGSGGGSGSGGIGGIGGRRETSVLMQLVNDVFNGTMEGWEGSER